MSTFTIYITSKNIVIIVIIIDVITVITVKVGVIVVDDAVRNFIGHPRF